VSTVQLAITVGILVSYLAGALWTASGNWQSMLLVGAVPGVVMLLVVAAVPESPRWYLLHGRIADAERAHRRLTGGTGDALPAQQAVAVDGSWRDLFVGRNLMVLVLATGLFMFANLSGIDAILYYAPTIFAEVGFGGTHGPILATVGIGTINVLANVVAMALIDRLGRRPLLIWGLVPMAASLLLLAAALLVGKGAGWSNVAALACLGLFVLAFGVSLGPLPYVLMSELFPLALRGPGMGIASAAAWGINVVVSLTFPVLIAAFGIALVFGFYGAVSVGALLFVVALVPETRGRSLELIEANLAAGRAVRDLGMPLANRSSGG
jgi:MFS transporter, SP family, galactose:H+ symporter